MTWQPKEETARVAIIGPLAPILNRAACVTAFVALSFSVSAHSQKQLSFIMLYPVTDTRYAFGYVGGASTPAASIKTLAAAGPLLLSKEHRLATRLPEAFDGVTHAPAVATTQTWIHSMILGSLLYDTALADGGMHFAVGGRAR